MCLFIIRSFTKATKWFRTVKYKVCQMDDTEVGIVVNRLYPTVLQNCTSGKALVCIKEMPDPA